MLKQDAVVEYLIEIHKKYAFILTDKAANNIAKMCKKYCITVILREIVIQPLEKEI